MGKPSFAELPPQVLLAPMTTYSSRPDGVISDDEIPYYRARAEGGFDWVVTAACCVHPSGWSFDGQWQASGRQFLPSLRRVADAIRDGGSRSILQIHHGGRQAPSRLCGGPVSASAVASERPNAETPRELTTDEVYDLIEAYVVAARLAEEAGYDGVEIHGANTYLIQQFVSPHSNRRTDEFGNDRLFFAELISRGVVEAVGETMVVGYRFSPEEPETPGIRLSDTFALIDRLAPIGLDYLHISLRRYDQSSIHDPESEPVLAQVARKIAERVPLVGVGGIQSWADFKACLSLGVHSVAVGRMGVINADWPRRAKAGDALRVAVPASGAAEALVLPRGLADKIYATPGWFPMEDVTPAATS